MNKPLYEQDFFRWTEQQTDALRAAAATRINLPLEWENLAEEIESLGRSQRRELGSRILVIVEHLMKLQASPAKAPRRGWEATVIRERVQVRNLLDDSPSLRGVVPDLVANAIADARRVVERELAQRRENHQKLLALDYTADQVLGDWLPD
jgi:hypothetical protein